AKSLNADALAFDQDSSIFTNCKDWLPGLIRVWVLPAPESPKVTWLKKWLVLESLVAALPPDPPAADCCTMAAVVDDGITCFVRGAWWAQTRHCGATWRPAHRGAARHLDQATLGAVMIPAFKHAGEHAALLLDVPLLPRLVRGFLKEGAASKANGATAARVARMVDTYLAEAGLKAVLRPAEFEELARRFAFTLYQTRQSKGEEWRMGFRRR
ncbi:hypothetical protein U9M48_009490, partial [Paspalum notatum var. saurae]